MNVSQPLTQAQIMVLGLVNHQYSDNDLSELKKILLAFNHQKMQAHLDEFVSENKFNDTTFDLILKGHNRKNM